MVQRYENDYGDIIESDGGPLVTYEDYEKLKLDRDYWYYKCLDAGLLDAERAADQQEQRELLDKQYRDAEEV